MPDPLQSTNGHSSPGRRGGPTVDRTESRRERRQIARAWVMALVFVTLVVGAGFVLRASHGAPRLRASPRRRASTSALRSPPTTTTTTTTTPAVDASELPQTPDRPPSQSVALDTRVLDLWHAIITDQPAAAMPFFFPLGAYNQVKAIPDPASDWQHRLVGAYERDIHALHAGLAGQPATLDAISIPATPQWIQPGVEHNKGSYWRVYGATIHYTVAGARRAITIASMISWRGEWYVVHLARIA